MNTSTHSIGGLVERQMRNWEIARRQAPAEIPNKPAVQPFVTISRMVGSGGGEVAKLLAERTGWPLFDREVLYFMAGDDTTRRRLYETMDERDVSFVEATLRAFTAPELKRDDFFHRLTETVLALARQGRGIFLGRGADLILPRDAGLRVRINSLPAACVEHYAKRRGLEPVAASREIARMETDRVRFLRSYFHSDPEAPDRFDVQFNLASLSIDDVVGALMGLMASRQMT